MSSTWAGIFSSLADRAAAARCRLHLEGLRIATTVFLDGREAGHQDWPRPGEWLTWFRRRGRLLGTECALGMAEALLELPGEILAKVDADMALSPAGAEWLQGATAGARGFRLGPTAWAGCWAAPRWQLAAAREWIARRRCTGCPEIQLFGHGFGATGGFTAATALVQVWRPGRPLRPDAPLHTLPSRMPTPERRAAAASLFDNFVQA